MDAFIAADYKTVVEALAPLSKDFLYTPYEDIIPMYEEACFQYAIELFTAQQPFEALRYFQEVPTYKNVEEKWLQRPVYLMLGQWRSVKGYTAEFREDYTCTIDGVDYYYNVPNDFAISLGSSMENVNKAYEIVDCTKKKLNLRNLKTGTVYYFTRVE